MKNYVKFSLGNDLSKDEVFDELQKYDSYGYRPWRGRWKRSYVPYWNTDRFDSFEDAGMVILTNSVGERERKYCMNLLGMLPS